MNYINSELSLKQKINLGNPHPQNFISKLGVFLKENYPLEEDILFELYSSKNSCGNERPPQEVIHVYERAASIMKLLLENPTGLKRLRIVKSKLKRRGVKKPVKKLSCSVANYIKYLVRANLIERSKASCKGYYTSKKGKAIVNALLENEI